ncbi:T9SS type A sorting domain-containing protein, partial [candidate division WOR-3 bacterium]|nr:T9SS type A sorting domain-containing protein [candidate division WOR-3 bacterium]
ALSAGTEITSDVTGSGWSSGELASGNAREMRVEVTPPSSASNGTSYDVLVTSTSVADDAFEDAIKATTTVKIGGVEEKTAPLAYFLYVSPLSSGKGFAITYTLPQASKVTLSVYDAAGRAVKVLEFGMVEAGSHEVELGDVSLSKGVYFVKFSSGSFTETAKLIILK